MGYFDSYYHIHRKEIYSLEIQSSPYMATEESGGAMLTGKSLVITPKHDTLPNEELSQLNDQRTPIMHSHGPHDIEFNAYFKPNGTPGADLSIQRLLRSALAEHTTSQVTVHDTPAPDSNHFSTQNTGVLNIGDIVVLPVGNGYQAAFICDVEDNGTYDTIELEEDLSTPLSAGDVIQATRQFSPIDDDTGQYLTVRKYSPGGMEGVAGAKVMEYTFSCGRSKAVDFNIKLMGRHHFGVRARAVLDEAVDDSATTIKIKPTHIWGADSAHNIMIQIGDEILNVTGYDPDEEEATVTRGYQGSSASSHSEGATINPGVAGIQHTGRGADCSAKRRCVPRW